MLNYPSPSLCSFSSSTFTDCSFRHLLCPLTMLSLTSGGSIFPVSPSNPTQNRDICSGIPWDPTVLCHCGADRDRVALCSCASMTLWLGCHKHEELICPAVVGWILRRTSMLTKLLLPHQSLQTSSCPQPPGSVVDTSNISAALVTPVSIRL